MEEIEGIIFPNPFLPRFRTATAQEHQKNIPDRQGQNTLQTRHILAVRSESTNKDLFWPRRLILVQALCCPRLVCLVKVEWVSREDTAPQHITGYKWNIAKYTKTMGYWTRYMRDHQIQMMHFKYITPPKRPIQS